MRLARQRLGLLCGRGELRFGVGVALRELGLGREYLLERVVGDAHWKSKLFKMAKQAVMKSGNYAFAGRKMKKRTFRSMWIARLSAAVAPYGMNYSTFMNGVHKAGITMNRKSLSEMAIHDAAAFAAVVEKAKAALN